MNRTLHKPEQIISKLKTADQLLAQGQTVANAWRVLEVSLPPSTADDSSTEP